MITRRLFLAASAMFSCFPFEAKAKITPVESKVTKEPKIINIDMDTTDVIFQSELLEQALRVRSAYRHQNTPTIAYRLVEHRRNKTGDKRPICLIIDEGKKETDVSLRVWNDIPMMLLYVSHQIFVLDEDGDEAVVMKDVSGMYVKSSRLPLRFSGTVSSEPVTNFA